MDWEGYLRIFSCLKRLNWKHSGVLLERYLMGGPVILAFESHFEVIDWSQASKVESLIYMFQADSFAKLLLILPKWVKMAEAFG